MAGKRARSAAVILGSIACYASAGEVMVTCGSVVKLRHEPTGYHLHSHPIKWGGGSGQQSVTSHGSEDDQGSMWIVKEADGAMPCEVGEPIECGAAIRLEHVATGKNLHSHSFSSPLSRQQEVSCFGESGEGDNGDSWELQCVRKGEKKWTRGAAVKLKHANTQRYLITSDKNKFTQQNCPNCPIVGQMEVTCGGSAGVISTWKADQGVYLGAS